MSTEHTQKRLAILERGAGRIESMARQIEDLRSALAEMCTGQQSQDEAICALQRRVQQLEAERAMRVEAGKFGLGDD